MGLEGAVLSALFFVWFFFVCTFYAYRFRWWNRWRRTVWYKKKEHKQAIRKAELILKIPGSAPGSAWCEIHSSVFCATLGMPCLSFYLRQKVSFYASRGVHFLRKCEIFNRTSKLFATLKISWTLSRKLNWRGQNLHCLRRRYLAHWMFSISQMSF